ncbi:MAG: tyrosine-type recombinase/integrase [Rhodobacteraceae bacterium]|nr:tyrosine-type recombinase/integrase [Paracoccaceae bacterium]
MYYAYLTIPSEYRPLFKNRVQLKRSLGTTDNRIASKLLRDKEAEMIEEIRKKDYENHPLVKVALDIQNSLWKKVKYQASDWLDAKTKTVAYLDVMEEANRQIMAGLESGKIKYLKPDGKEIDDASQYFRKYIGQGLMTKTSGFRMKRLSKSSGMFYLPDENELIIDRRNEPPPPEYTMVIEGSLDEPDDNLTISGRFDQKANAEPLMVLKIQLERLFIEYSDEKSLPTKQGKFVGEVIEEYLNDPMFTNIERHKTKNEYRSKLETFRKWASYQTLDSFTAHSPYEYIRMLLDPANPLGLGKTRAEDGVPSNGTIKKYLTPVKRVFSFATRNGHIGFNPFENVEVKDYGHKQIDRIDWTDEQLTQLFNLDMPDRERLAFTLMAITGFRLDEVALLEWDQITEVNGILCLDLTTIDVTVKGKNSQRLLPIPDMFKDSLPERGEGKLFNYRRDKLDGKAQNHASRSCMKFVRQVTLDPRCDLHSLRHTFTTKMRNSGIDGDLIKFLLGHSLGGVPYGKAHQLENKLIAMNKLAEQEFSFLNTPRLTDDRTIIDTEHFYDPDE